MNVKERILSLRLLEKMESNQNFLEEIGVVVTLKAKDSGTENKSSCRREKNDYETVHSK